MSLDVTFQVLRLMIIDTVFVLICLMFILPLSRLKRASYAVLKRNFFGYFNNISGYVFICIFVIMASCAAFWPYEFFNANLANLGQLNKWFPIAMLLFIPTITMSIWADERRQGTDELLLTIPATDWDIVLGKYLAVASIFTVSLLFSQLANFIVLNFLSLGDIDTGMFATSYFGYWLVGLAMLAIGMAASFLTSNLTVGFVLGVVFNAPLVLASMADVVVASTDRAQLLSHWSYGSQFDDFGRGVVSFKSIAFFAMITVIGLYASIVLIGRRHWYGGRDGDSLLGHYLVRGLALVIVTCAANVVFSYHDLFRYDATSEKVSSLSPDTQRLLANLDPKHPVLIEAFISKVVPDAYAKTRVDLISMLKELEARAGSQIDVRIYDNLETFSDDAVRAEQQYGIEPTEVFTQERGAYKREKLFMGAAFTSGLEKVVVPFFDFGIPVEYEIVRSITTVAQAKRNRIGVLKTDAELFGGIDFQTFSQRPKQLIVQELEKQYEVVEVDPNNPIEQYDVLMAVQPSSLTPPQLENLIDAIRRGQPTALFEDPMPLALRSAPGTGQPKRPQGGMFGGAPPEEKGDVRRLWAMLGIEMQGRPGMMGPAFDADVIWQAYNPYPKAAAGQITPEWVFTGPDAPGWRDPLEALTDRAKKESDPARKAYWNRIRSTASNLSQLLFLFPGAIKADESKGLTFSPLVSTGSETGTITYADVQAAMRDPFYLDQAHKSTHDRFILAAHVTGKVKDEAVQPAQPGAENPEQAGREQDINVIFVSDIDLMASEFLAVRARPEGEINWNFDNVTFVLNILDVLAGDERLVEIRKRQTRHSTLKMIDAATEDARDDFSEARKKFQDQYNEAVQAARDEMNQQIAKLQKEVDEARAANDEDRVRIAMTKLGMHQQTAEQRLTTRIAQLERDRDKQTKGIEQDLNKSVLRVQSLVKLAAVLLPPIPPLVVGLFVFLRRMRRESEGVSQSRLR